MAIRSTGKDRWQVKVYRGVDEHGKQVWEYRSADGCRGGRICPLDAALDSAWGAALGAADVADALVVRDLIDEATPWNQAAYDLLVAPWAAVIGPAHPDDRRNNEG